MNDELIFEETAIIPAEVQAPAVTVFNQASEQLVLTWHSG